MRRGKYEKVRAQSAKRIERRAKAVEKSLKGSYGLGNLFGGDEEVVVPKKKRAKKAKAEVAVEDMTPGERAQHEAAKVANRLYGAKAKAPKFA